MSSRFIHLHTHSHYSLLNALPKIPDLIGAAKEAGMDAIALTDSGNLYGAIEFYKECKKAQIKPIIGVDFYVAPRGRKDKEPSLDSGRFRLLLLAKDLNGYKNLISLVTISYLEGFFYKPRIDKEILKTYNEGLVAIIPSLNSEVGSALRSAQPEKAKGVLSFYTNIFGKENVYLEKTHHPDIEDHLTIMERTSSLSKETGVPLLAANDVYYLKLEDRKALQVMRAIQSGGGNEAGEGEDDFSFIDEKRALELFKDEPEAIENTRKVADICNLEIPLGAWVFPPIDTGKSKTHDEELRRIVYEGIEKRGLSKTEEITSRIEYELEIIKNKGYAPYFLVVADLLHFAHDHNILTTIRGSVAGSLVTYLAGITTVNPIEYGLPFERFLNPERPSAPDIDMDYADNRRDEVIEYARKKYGRDHVAQIGTFGTMMARGAVRDVARALGYPYSVGDRIAKFIPFGSQGFPMYIDRALEISEELKNLYDKDADTRAIIDMAKKIEGCARHISIHAAGVVMSPTPLTDFTPLQFDPKESGKIITQYDMWSVEDVGLLKFDFLGIRNLAILAESVRLVKENRGISVDIENIPLDDKKTFELLGRGETIGLFQLNGSGMTRFLRELRPSSIHDINAMVALYRPGPMESIPEYIRRKHNPELVRYLDPRMKKFLEKSYGLIVYQDDLLFCAIDLAGYSWLEADKFRKAVGKKIPEEMAAQKEKFLKGIVTNGQTAEFADMLWKLFEPFQSYGFNKAHAASYGRVAYQTSYMKANFPGEYMTAILTSEAGDIDKVSEIIAESKRMGIPVLPPDINESYKDFTLVREKEGDKIRFGLGSIKNFGEGIAGAIIEERAKGGKFKNLGDFLERIHDRNLNKKSLEALIYCGALDQFGERGTLITNIESLLAHNKESVKTGKDQTSLFGENLGGGDGSSLHLSPGSPLSQDERLKWEKELLGLYVSGHPLEKFKDKLKDKTLSIHNIKEDLQPGMIAVASGIIEDVKSILTKNNERMLFVRLVDFTGPLEVVVFPRLFSDLQNLLQKDSCVSIKGKLNRREGQMSMVAEAVKVL